MFVVLICCHLLCLTQWTKDTPLVLLTTDELGTSTVSVLHRATFNDKDSKCASSRVVEEVLNVGP